MRKRGIFFDNPLLPFYLHGMLIGGGLTANLLMVIGGQWWGAPLAAFGIWLGYRRLQMEQEVMAHAFMLETEDAYRKGKAECSKPSTTPSPDTSQKL